MMITIREWPNHLADLLQRERSAMAEFLVALAEFDAKRLWEQLGHPSLFYFLHRELRLPKGPAFYRKTAAELVQRFPEVVEPLRDGRLCLTSVIELSKVLTPENRHEVLPRFFGLSKREAQAAAVALAPLEDAPMRELVTAVPSAAARVGMVPATTETLGPPRAVAAAPSRDPECVARDPTAGTLVLPEEPPDANSGFPGGFPIRTAAPRTAPDEAEPLSADLRRLHLTVSQALLEKIDAARSALSHSHPGASTGAILEAGLDLLLERAAKRKGLVAKPRATPRPTTTDAIPAAVKREVWKRAGGRCEWPLEDGGVCGSTLRLEFDHVVPRALGGPSTFTNVRVTCRSHNLLAARQVFGEEHMRQFTHGARPRPEKPRRS